MNANKIEWEDDLQFHFAISDMILSTMNFHIIQLFFFNNLFYYAFVRIERPYKTNEININPWRWMIQCSLIWFSVFSIAHAL